MKGRKTITHIDLQWQDHQLQVEELCNDRRTPEFKVGTSPRSAGVFDSAGRPNVAPGRESSQWPSPCAENNKEVEVGVRVDVQKTSSKGTTMPARATLRARCEDDYFYQDTNTHS